MTHPLFTIITPTYNHEAYIAQCLQSVVAQTYERWEQIVVDDGSSDRTREIVEDFARRDPRIRLIALPHRGLQALADTYNQALRVGQGELIAVLEGDDYWAPAKLAAQVSAFEEPDVLLSWGVGHTVDGSGRVTGELRKVTTNERRTLVDARTLFRRLAHDNVLTPSINVVVRADVLREVGGFNQEGTAHYVDLPTWLRVIASRPDGRASFENVVLGYYRMHAAQTSQRYAWEMAIAHTAVVDRLVSTLDVARLQRLGWSPRLQRDLHSREQVARGFSALRSDRRRAMAHFASALRSGGPTRNVAMALGGIASALLGKDLVAWARGARATMRGAWEPRR